MRIQMMGAPRMLQEATELVYAYVNDLPPASLTGEGPYCIPVLEVQRMMHMACAGLNRQNPAVSFFFQSCTLTDGSCVRTCIARNMIYLASNYARDPGGKSLADSLAVTRALWEDSLRGREYPVSIGKYTIDCGWKNESVPESPSFAQSIAGLPLPQYYQARLQEALGHYGQYARQLEGLLTPVAQRLEQLLLPWVKRAEPLRNAWEAYFSQPNLPQLLEQHWQISAAAQMDEICVALRYLDARTKLVSMNTNEGKRVLCVHIGVSNAAENLRSSEFAPWVIHSLRLMGSASRLQMLQAMKKKPMSIRELVQELDMHMGTVGRDISSLLTAGLVTVDVSSDRRRYQTDANTIRTLIRLLGDLLPEEETP